MLWKWRAARRIGGRTAGGLILGILGAAIVSSGSASASVGCPAARSSLSASYQPACWQPFTASSAINTPLPPNPVLAADNTAVKTHMASYGWNLNGSSTSFRISDNGTRPVYFANPSDPTLTVNCTSAEGPGTCQGYNGINVNGAHIHVPAHATPGNNWDAHMIIIQTDTGQEYDFWHASISGTTLTAGTGSVTNVNTSDGTHAGGTDAANLALTAGLLRPSELASGQINHALVITVPCTNAHGANVGYSWPATGGWGEPCGQYWNETTTGAPTIGALLRLNLTDTQIAASGAPAWEQTIMTALAHYGAYAEDTNGSWHDEGMHILTQDPISWTSLGQPDPWARVLRDLGGGSGGLTSHIPIPMSRLQVVAACVPRETCRSASNSRTREARIASSQHHTRHAKRVRSPRSRSRTRTQAAHRHHARHGGSGARRGRNLRQGRRSHATRPHHRASHRRRRSGQGRRLRAGVART